MSLDPEAHAAALAAALQEVDPRRAVVTLYTLLRQLRVPAQLLDEVGRDRCRDAMILGQALKADDDLDRSTELDGLCTRPPAGWRCNLDAGHEGPCPTVPSNPCQRCGGDGEVGDYSRFGPMFGRPVACPDCGGTGRTPGRRACSCIDIPRSDCCTCGAQA